MNIAHIDTVRSALGDQKIRVLGDIFDHCKGEPPQVPATRYRADHPSWLNILDEIGTIGPFLQRGDTGDNYQVNVYTLPLIDNAHAKALLDIMDAIYLELKRLYPIHLNAMIPVTTIVAAISADTRDIQDALYYLTGANNVSSGRSAGFPYVGEAKMGISESVLRYQDFGSVLSQFYEWNFANPQRRVNTWEAIQIHAMSTSSPGFFTANDVATRPPWYEHLDDVTKALISELDGALRADLIALPTMGLRMLIESVMRDHVGEKGSFKEYLTSFRQAGYVTDQHAKLIEAVVDAGHASAHRAYFPNAPDLRICIDVVKHLMEGVYVLKPKVDSVSENTPTRTPKKSLQNKNIG